MRGMPEQCFLDAGIYSVEQPVPATLPFGSYNVYYVKLNLMDGLWKLSIAAVLKSQSLPTYRNQKIS